MHVLLMPSWYASPADLVYGSFFREQAHALLRAAFQVGVISPQLRSIRRLPKSFLKLPLGVESWDDGGLQTLLHHGWDWFSKIPKLHSAIWLKRGERLFRRYVQQFGLPDLLHAHSALYGGALAARLSDKYQIPYVVTEHSSHFGRNVLRPWQHRAAKRVFQSAAARLVVSPELGKLLNAKYGDDIGPLEWVPNMVDPMFHPAANSSSIPSHRSARLRLLSVAAFKKNKGHSVLIQAVRRAITAGCHVELRLIGDGPEARSIEQQILKLGVSGSVIRLGRLGRDDVAREMQACDALIVSSHYETFGVVIIEALACGKPVIATACGGPDCIVNPSNGFLVRPGDEEEMAAAIVLMQSAASRFNSETIRRNCLEHFGEAALVDSLAATYERVLSGAEQVATNWRRAA